MPGDEDGTGPAFLCDAVSVAQGEEVFAVARLQDGRLPKRLVVTGTLDGQPFRRELAADSVDDGARAICRTWAKLELERLLTEDARKNKDAIIKLSTASYVMTPYTSLLVLENDAMYRGVQRRPRSQGPLGHVSHGVDGQSRLY